VNGEFSHLKNALLKERKTTQAKTMAEGREGGQKMLSLSTNPEALNVKDVSPRRKKEELN